MEFLTQFFKNVFELHAILLFACLLFALTPRHPCVSKDCDRCNTIRWAEFESSAQLPYTPLQKRGVTFSSPALENGPSSPEMAHIQTVTGIFNMNTLERISAPKLSSPRTTTSPIISKEEFSHILETSPHARKFVHALAMRMVAERQKRRLSPLNSPLVSPKL